MIAEVSNGPHRTGDTKSQRLAVVTGASRGIGAEITARLVESGFLVIGISKEQKAERSHDWHRCNVGDAKAVEETINKVYRTHGTIDVLVNSAGISECSSLTSTSNELWERTLATNLTGAFLMMRHVMQPMIHQRWGRIINIASIASKRGEPDMATYCAAKHGVLGLTRSAALQVAKFGITVNAVCPAAVATDMLEHFISGWSLQTGRKPEAARRILLSQNPQNRILGVNEIARIVEFLTTDEAAGINGQAINVCGGLAYN